MSLNKAITSALEIKCDTTCFNELLAIRNKARAMGITDIDARIHRVNLAMQKPKPEPVEPPKQKEPDSAIQTHETESNQANSRQEAKTISDDSALARKTTKQYDPPARRKDSDSKILAMADAKKKG